MRSQQEIDAEIAKLEDYKGRVRHGMFDNRAAIDSQMCVLREKLNTDGIYNRWPDDDRDCEIRFNASDAMDWMNGDKDEAPSVEWEPLLQ